MSDYKHIPTERLQNMWNQRRLHLRMGEAFRRDLDEVYAMKRELDRRAGGGAVPAANVNFENYISD